MSKVGAYIHAKPDGTPFYVGKGTPKRMKEFHGRNKHHHNLLNKYGRKGVQVGFIECSNDEIALSLEVGLIKCLRNMGYDLANYTNGGDVGASGYRWTDEQRAKYSSIRNKMKLGNEHKKNISKSLKGKPKPERSKAHKLNHKAAMQSRRWYNNGEYVVFCKEGEQPDGYVSGRGSLKFKSERTLK